WAPLIDLDAAYTYYPTYAQVLNEYNRPNALPTFMVEANYEFERAPRHLLRRLVDLVVGRLPDGGSVPNLRRQEYWTMLSGPTGQLYGSAFTWRFPADWRRNLDTPGVLQLSYMKRLFAVRKWYDLI